MRSRLQIRCLVAHSRLKNAHAAQNLAATRGVRIAAGGQSASRVGRYPVYDYVSGSAFWAAVTLSGLLITGVLVACIAAVVRLRPMSAALATVAVMAFVFAVDAPITMWLFDRPLGTQMTFAYLTLRWLRGVSMFGGAILIGGAIARMSPYLHIRWRVRPSSE